MARRRRADKVARIRWSIIGSAAAVAVLLAGYGLVYSLGLVGGGEGEPYTELDTADDDGGATQDLVVMEFFSYTCPRCQAFDERVEDWLPTLPEGTVFRRIHVGFSAEQRRLAKAHLALKRNDALADNHQRIFRAIHDQGRRFTTDAAIAEFVSGIDRETFDRAFASPRTQREMEIAEENIVKFRVSGVPTVIVDGRYQINMAGGARQALATVDDLLEQRLADRLADRLLEGVEEAEEESPEASNEADATDPEVDQPPPESAAGQESGGEVPDAARESSESPQ